MADDSAAQLVLGSASPRRADLLREMGVDFVVRSVDLDERAFMVTTETDPGRHSAQRIAQAKFAALSDKLGAEQQALAAGPKLLTADTLVSCNDAVLGKPDNDADLAAMLRDMSGSEIQIATGLCLGRVGSEPTSMVVVTRVQLHHVSHQQIAAYVATGAGRDKAAGLALQSEANHFVASVRGCWANVLGLPLCAAAEMLDLDATGYPQHERCSVDLCGHAGR